MADLSPEQWRVLNHLYQHKLHTVRPKLAHVRQSQHVTDADLLDLDEMYLIGATIAGRDVSVSAIRNLAKHARLRLTGPGLRYMSADPFNQMRYTLSRHAQPITLRRLFTDNTITHDDVEAAARDRQITVTIAEDFPHDFGTRLAQLPATQVRVALTSKGREYLPR
ncbi:hypothetical protein AB0C29_15300 [Actinoplanes sp. NPDC048791]|uniref:hypothetical protein n=1 Tax=Actinoplanes sp. NPDC048791 TaxID=3154623 RepID=UPI0033ECB0A7